MRAACAAQTSVGAVAEQQIVASGSVRIRRRTVVGALVARGRAVAVGGVQRQTRVTRMDRAGAAATGVGAVAEDAVATRRGVAGMLTDRTAAVAGVVRARVTVVGAQGTHRLEGARRGTAGRERPIGAAVVTLLGAIDEAVAAVGVIEGHVHAAVVPPVPRGGVRGIVHRRTRIPEPEEPIAGLHVGAERK